MPVFRVLIVESDASEAEELRDLVQCCECTTSTGAMVPVATHSVQSAAMAQEAYREFPPSLVIFGPVAAAKVSDVEIRRLRQSSGVELVPILFVQDLTGQETPPAPPTICDDILAKPYSLPLVELKLASIRRFSDFSRSLIAQRDRLRRHYADFLHEQASAREIFGNLGNESCLDDTSAIRYHLSPRAVLNGDLLAATYTPDGKLVLMLGDFSGHGLAAAVGAVPLTSIFYSMMPRGFSMSRVLREINRKLYGILPRQMFCCLVMLELDPRRSHLRVLNAGMPSPCLKRSNGELRLLESRHLPFGVLSSDQIDTAIVNLRVLPGDRLFLWSDGIHEARNSKGEHFGEERLLELLRAAGGSDHAFDQILMAVNAHAAEQHDDLSLVELDLSDTSLRKSGGPELDQAGDRKGSRIGNWSIRLQLSQEELRTSDPLPHLLSVLVQMPGAARFQEDLATALGELFRNALEHGVLGLDSSIKTTDDGFVRYYDLLAERRSRLKEGWVSISLSCSESEDRGTLVLVVEDSGSGFAETREPPSIYAGRGLNLLQTVCDEVNYLPGSSKVEAVIRWSKAAEEQDMAEGHVNAMQNPPLPV
ncbi:ATP-binding SpoIIE family protein phosphatase [Microbulbifer hydrolyticus]|uniref:Serine phosphatase RsbU (Regulator of sigma subunit)/anti-sigma regulatory factor (Ser/Thr protein kinase) n=1 Tax=Microbulbifer hydrolyticus TaxID=48074 RepID=A0A6P1TAY2_9GAMM|nr:ATP-binding SpoIIE family protein phosphatase [Microbulbifer hydrolyticus]MBB5210739.1 serine phosphatase RsbU (regulator of sigma subunit)/anti-sigma regulatory factor (Ser/Thr protein kinase) [Microbulbifer hydrolyticus]QHQ38813.1 SpoIIE family protein phosphatase [Microbulbifer hydrolyticus]